MKSIRKIIWVFPHPTPYNVYLLNGLGGKVAVPSEAVYRWATLPNHPWSALPERRFSWRVIDNPGHADRKLNQEAASDHSALFVFVGWRDSTVFPALFRRWRNRLPYAFWSDTPKVGNSIGRRIVNGVQRFFTKRAMAMLATGSPAISNYEAIGVEPGKLKSFPFVVDPSHFGAALAARAIRQPDAPVTFVLPARLVDQLKGQRVAIEALMKAKEQLPVTAMRLVLAGVGPDEEALREFAQQCGVNKETEFRGWVEYEKMPALLGEADVLLLPSRWDPFPVAVIEGMAAGLPILASSACGSAVERVRDGENGYIHPAGDSTALAGHMVAVAKSPALRATMSAKALETSQRWGIDHAAEVVNWLVEQG